jgi:hypothetical protein
MRDSHNVLKPEPGAPPLGRWVFAALLVALAPFCRQTVCGAEPLKAGVFSERLPDFDQALADEINGQ